VDLSEQAHELPEGDETRRELARRAAELDPSLGDPYVMLAGYLEGEQAAQPEREQLLSQALAGDFVTISRDDAVADMVELLLLQNRPQEALSLLHAEFQANGDTPLERIMGAVDRADRGAITAFPATELNRVDRLYVAALMAGDAPWFAGRVVQRLRARFPMDRSLAAIDWRRGSHVSLAVLEWIDAVEQLTGTASAEMYRELLRADPPELLVPELLERYQRAGGDDPLVDALSVVYGNGEPPTIDSLLSDKLMWEILIERLDRSSISEHIQDALTEIRHRDRVVLTRDDNRDGYWEERYVYENGELTLWQLDDDQDGRVSVAVDLSGPAARVAVRREPEEDTIVIDYGSYPLVSRVRWITSAGGREWTAAQPVPFDVGISGSMDIELWNALGRRVTVDSDVFDRFQRQRRSDDSRAVVDDEIRELRMDLQQWGLIE
jgi:hypothetical protein